MFEIRRRYKDLSIKVAIIVKDVCPRDVSYINTKNELKSANFKKILIYGSTTRVLFDSTHVVYICQLMEYLHPDDAIDHLKNIYRALVRR